MVSSITARRADAALSPQKKRGSLRAYVRTACTAIYSYKVHDMDIIRHPGAASVVVSKGNIHMTPAPVLCIVPCPLRPVRTDFRYPRNSLNVTLYTWYVLVCMTRFNNQKSRRAARLISCTLSHWETWTGVRDRPTLLAAIVPKSADAEDAVAF